MRRIVAYLAVTAALGLAQSCKAPILMAPVFSPLEPSGDTTASNMSAAQGWQLILAGDRTNASRVLRRFKSPESLAGLALLAYSSGNHAAELEAWLDLAGSFPGHPLCSVAAARIERLTRLATGFDRDVTAVLSRAVSHHGYMDPFARHWLTEVLARVQERNRGIEQARRTRKRLGHLAGWIQAGPFGRFPGLEPVSTFWPWSSQSPPAGDAKEHNTPGYGLPGDPFSKDTRSFRPARVENGMVVLGSLPQRGGVTFGKTSFRVDRESRAWLCLSSSSSFAVKLDGSTLFHRDRYGQYSTDSKCSAVVLRQGRHTIVVAVSSDMYTPSFELFLQGADGRPLKLEGVAGDNDFRTAGFELDDTRVSALEHYLNESKLDRANPLPRIWSSLLKLFLGDEVGSEEDMAKAMELAGPSPLLQFLHARILMADHALPLQTRRAAARSEFESCHAADPDSAGCLYWLSVIEGRESRPLKQIELLRRALEKRPRAWLWWLSLHKVYAKLGWKAEAEQTLKRLKSLDHGTWLAVARRWANRNMDFEAAARLTKEWSSLAPRSTVLARRLARAGHVDAAAAELERIVQGWGMKPALLRFKAGLLAEAGRFHAAAELLESSHDSLLPADMFQAGMYEVLAGNNDAAATALQGSAALRPTGGSAALQAALLQGGIPLQKFRIDARDVIQRSKDSMHGASVAILLDQYVLDLSRDGPALELVHTVTEVLTKKGVQESGEVDVPGNAWLLNLRVIKPDGHVLEPESIEGKSSISLPGLEPGDVIDLEYLADAGYSSVYQGGFVSDRFYFRTTYAPVKESQVIVLTRPDTELELELANAAKAPDVREGPGGVKIYEWTARDLEPMRPEPSSPPVQEFLPYMRAGVNVSRQDKFMLLASLVPERLRAERHVVEFAKAAVQGLKAPRDKVKALFTAVLQKVDTDTGGIRSSASYTLARGKGSRAVLLAACLRAVGIRADLVAVKSFDMPEPDIPEKERDLLPPFAEFGTFVVRAVPDRRRPIWLDPRFKFAEFDYLNPMLRERPAVVLARSGPREITTPTFPVSRDREDIAIQVNLRRDGSAAVKGVELLRGWQAAWLRENLVKLSEIQVRHLLEMALSRYFPGMDLKKFDLKNVRQGWDQTPLRIEYELEVSRMARSVQGSLVIDRGIRPLAVAKSFLRVSKPRLALLVSNQWNTHVEVHVRLPKGFEAVPPKEVEIQNRFGMYRLRCEPTMHGLFLDKYIHIPLNRISPKDFREFYELCKRADEAESSSIELKPQAK